jgi:hypothetical protein
MATCDVCGHQYIDEFEETFKQQYPTIPFIGVCQSCELKAKAEDTSVSDWDDYVPESSDECDCNNCDACDLRHQHEEIDYLERR